MSEMWMDTGSSVYLSLWCQLLRGGKLLLLLQEELGGRKRCHHLQFLGIGFGRHIVLFIGVHEAIFGEVDHLVGEERGRCVIQDRFSNAATLGVQGL